MSNEVIIVSSSCILASVRGGQATCGIWNVVDPWAYHVIATPIQSHIRRELGQ